MNQTDFSEIAGCSVSTIQAIELKRLALSHSLATKIEQATVVSRTWLLANDLSAPPVTAGGQPYTREEFENWNAYLARGRTVAHFYTDIPGRLFDAYAIMRGVMMHAAEHGERNMALYRLSRFLEDFRAEFTGKRVAHDAQYGENSLKLASNDLAFIAELRERVTKMPHLKSLLGPFAQTEDRHGEEVNALVPLVGRELKAFFDALDYHFAWIAAANHGKLPDSCAINLLDMNLVQMCAGESPKIEMRDAEYFYRGVRLFEHNAVAHVKRGLPVPVRNPLSPLERFRGAFVALYKHWQAFRKLNDEKPKCTYLNPVSLDAIVNGLAEPKIRYSLPVYQTDAERADLNSSPPPVRRTKKGEPVIFWDDRPIVLKVDPALEERKFRSI